MSDLQKILDAAYNHGSLSEPDHECGDLQDCLREAWEHLSETGRKKLMVSDTVTELLERWGDEELLESE